MADVVLSTIMLPGRGSVTCRRCYRAAVFFEGPEHALLVWDHGTFTVMIEPGRGVVHRCGVAARWACSSCDWEDIDQQLETRWRSRRRRPRCPACSSPLQVMSDL